MLSSRIILALVCLVAFYTTACNQKTSSLTPRGDEPSSSTASESNSTLSTRNSSTLSQKRPSDSDVDLDSYLTSTEITVTRKGEISATVFFPPDLIAQATTEKIPIAIAQISPEEFTNLSNSNDANFTLKTGRVDTAFVTAKVQDTVTITLMGNKYPIVVYIKRQANPRVVVRHTNENAPFGSAELVRPVAEISGLTVSAMLAPFSNSLGETQLNLNISSDNAFTTPAATRAGTGFSCIANCVTSPLLTLPAGFTSDPNNVSAAGSILKYRAVLTPQLHPKDGTVLTLSSTTPGSCAEPVAFPGFCGTISAIRYLPQSTQLVIDSVAGVGSIHSVLLVAPHEIVQASQITLDAQAIGKVIRGNGRLAFWPVISLTAEP